MKRTHYPKSIPITQPDGKLVALEVRGFSGVILPGLIAIVSHDTGQLRSIDDALTADGFQTMLLSRSSGAFEALRKAQPDLVMLDTRIESDEAGWDLVQALRLDMNTAKIPLLILSTEDPTVFERKAPALRQNQHVEVLPVPFDAPELVATIKRMLPA